MERLLDIALIGLLAATLFHALRLERALGVLKRDRSTLESLIAGFNESTRQAQEGIVQLQEAADGAGRSIARQTEAAQHLKDDLAFLVDRGDRLADRLDVAVRSARAASGEASRDIATRGAPAIAAADPPARMRSQAERDLLQALRLAR
ncbi:MAG: hypothetical protein KGL12_08960 [Rhodospirillales bacterium]|nr:hypothetical protein [Rhodospirillales bacterium]